jgi:signal peptidase
MTLPDQTSAKTASSRSHERAVLRFVVHMLAWMVITAVLLVLAVTVLVPRLGGATPYTVLSSSMEPTMPPGTLVVARPARPASIGIGTVITYQLESGEPTVVTHRVVSQGIDGSGRVVFWTKGDGNDAIDAEAVLPVQVRGTLWYSAPYLGYVNDIVNTRVRSVVTSATVAGLLAYSLAMFAGGYRDRRKRPRV